MEREIYLEFYKTNITMESKVKWPHVSIFRPMDFENEFNSYPIDQSMIHESKLYIQEIHVTWSRVLYVTNLSATICMYNYMNEVQNLCNII